MSRRTPEPAGAASTRAGSITDGRLVADLAADRRLDVVGSAGSLLIAEGGPLYLDTPECRYA